MSDTLRNRIGKKVRVSAGNYPDLDPRETYTVVKAEAPKSAGKVFVTLKDGRGRTRGGVDEADLLPAPAATTPPAEARIMKAATSLMERTPGLRLADAVKQAARLDLNASTTWRNSIDAGTITQLAYDKVKANPGMTPRAAVTAVLRDQRAQQEASRVLNSLAEAEMKAHGVTLAQAARTVAKRHPELVAAAR